MNRSNNNDDDEETRNLANTSYLGLNIDPMAENEIFCISICKIEINMRVGM